VVFAKGTWLFKKVAWWCRPGHRHCFFLDRRHACVASVNDIFAHNPNAQEARRRCKDQWSPVITFYPRCYTHHQLPADQNWPFPVAGPAATQRVDFAELLVGSCVDAHAASGLTIRLAPGFWSSDN
jgi:hypothetical protein